MLHYTWSIVATAAASILFGCLCLAYLFRCGAHRNEKGEVASASMISSFLIGIAFYSFCLLALGQFFLDIPVSQTVRENFGDARVGWLALGVFADYIPRLYGVFHPHA